MTTAAKWKLGDTLRFRNRGTLLDSPDDAVIEGTINGEPLTTIDGFMYVPAWTERDRGREATTVYVHVGNVVDDDD